MNIEKIISGLLYEHDCVVIPGFGGFIGNYYPASILTTNHTFLPPSKSLLFNINLKQNDGLLVMRLATEEQLTYDQALGFIEQKVNEWHRTLQNGNRIDLKGVGELFNDNEGNLQFIQSKEVNYLVESYGLISFVSPQIKRESYQKKLEKKITHYLEPQQKSSRRLPKSLKWAAGLALPIGAATIFGITHFDKIKSVSGEYAGILFPEPSRSEVKAAPVKTPIKIKPVASVGLKVTQDVKSEQKEVEVKSAVEGLPSGDYSIIVGAFKFKENAESLVSDLLKKGYDAAIVGQTKTGLHRVQLRSFNSKTTAIQQLALVRSGEFPGAWLLVK